MKGNILKITTVCIAVFFLAIIIIYMAKDSAGNEITASDDGNVYYVNTQKALNMRSGPSTDYDIVGLLSSGTEVIVTERTDNGWYKIEFSGMSGYVFADYLTKAEAEIDDDTGITENSSDTDDTSDKDTFGITPVITALVAAIIIMLLLAVFTAFSFLREDPDCSDEENDE